MNTIHPLRRIRADKGLTQLQLALAAGTSREMISLLENGKRPEQRTADKVAAALGVEPLAIWPEYETFWRG